MNVPHKKTREAHGAQPFKPVVAQAKNAGGATPTIRRPVAPPVYRPQARPVVAQQKKAGLFGAKTPSMAPSASRPRPTPGVMQTKRVSHQPPASPSKLGEKRPVAPPPYRPQHMPKVMQTKKGNERPGLTGKENRHPVAPPVYRPDRSPAVLQRKTTKAKSQAPSSQSGRKPSAPPVYRPQPMPKALQSKMSAAWARTKFDRIMKIGSPGSIAQIIQCKIDPDFTTWLTNQNVTTANNTKKLTAKYVKNYVLPEELRAKTLGENEDHIKAARKAVITESSKPVPNWQTVATLVDTWVKEINGWETDDDDTHVGLDDSALRRTTTMRGRQELLDASRDGRLEVLRGQWANASKAAKPNLERQIAIIEGEVDQAKWRLLRLEREGILVPVTETLRSATGLFAPLVVLTDDQKAQQKARNKAVESQDVDFRLTRGFLSAAEGNARLTALATVLTNNGINDGHVGIRGSAVRGTNLGADRDYRLGVTDDHDLHDSSDHDYYITSPVLEGYADALATRADWSQGGSIEPAEFLNWLRNTAINNAAWGAANAANLANALVAFSTASQNLTGRKSDVTLNRVNLAVPDPHGGIQL